MYNFVFAIRVGAVQWVPLFYLPGIGNLRDYDDDGGQKHNRFYEQNNNSARASRFFVHFFATPAQLRREMSKF